MRKQLIKKNLYPRQCLGIIVPENVASPQAQVPRCGLYRSSGPDLLLQLPLEVGICSLCLFRFWSIIGDGRWLKNGFFCEISDPAMISLVCNVACKPEGRRNLHYRSPTLAYIDPGFTSPIHSSGRYFAPKFMKFHLITFSFQPLVLDPFG